MNEYITFQEFDTRDDADACAALLEENGIRTKIEENRILLDQSIIGTQYNNNVLLKLRGTDFTRARKVLIDNTHVDISDVAPDYMLRAFSNKELLDLIATPDEWGPYNYNVAIALLKQRDVKVEEGEVEKMQQHQLVEISRPRSLTLNNLLLGYGVSVFGIIGALLKSYILVLPMFVLFSVPGFFGIVFGLIYRLTRRTLPDGTRIYSYDAAARMHGLFMIVLNILAFLCVVMLCRN